MRAESWNYRACHRWSCGRRISNGTAGGGRFSLFYSLGIRTFNVLPSHNFTVKRHLVHTGLKLAHLYLELLVRMGGLTELFAKLCFPSVVRGDGMMVLGGHRIGLLGKSCLLRRIFGGGLIYGVLRGLVHEGRFRLGLRNSGSGGDGDMGEFGVMPLRDLGDDLEVEVVLDVLLDEGHIHRLRLGDCGLCACISVLRPCLWTITQTKQICSVRVRRLATKRGARGYRDDGGTHRGCRRHKGWELRA